MMDAKAAGDPIFRKKVTQSNPNLAEEQSLPVFLWGTSLPGCAAQDIISPAPERQDQLSPSSLRLRSQLMVAPSRTQCSQEAGTSRFCHKLDTVLSVFLSVMGSHARLPAPSSHAAQNIEWYHRIRRWHHRTAQWDKSNTGATGLAAAEAWLLILNHTKGLIGPLNKEETRRQR